MNVQAPDTRVLNDLIKDLDTELREIREDTLRIAEEILEQAEISVQSFHGIIGGKNNEYTDLVRRRFQKPDDFIASWLEGLANRTQLVVEQPFNVTGLYTSAEKVAALVRAPVTWRYIHTFLTRNFYRNIRERTRAKHPEILWQIWFGKNDTVWGLLIAPVHRAGEWTNDKSEMRRANYEYWTIGHILATGFIDPQQCVPYVFDRLNALIQFYQSVLFRASVSEYEQGIMQRYLDYLQQSADLHAEPFLIPELRYAGREVNHQYRLDFTVLNPYTHAYIGVEISPASTHNAVKEIRKNAKTQKQINEELAKTWAHEMTKRNEYFQTFGISTITFTDDDLKDLDACFERIAVILRQRPERRVTIEQQLERFRR